MRLGFRLARGEAEADPAQRLVPGALISSNVNAVNEMVNMIVAQRAYEMNSKVIESSDEMMRTMTQLR